MRNTEEYLSQALAMQTAFENGVMAYMRSLRKGKW